MYQFPEENAILMDYRPGASGSVYGKLGIITGKKAYVLEDSAARKGSFDSGNDQILPVWTSDGKAFCEGGAALAHDVRVDCAVYSVGNADEKDELLAARDGGVEEIPLEHHVVLRVD